MRAAIALSTAFFFGFGRGAPAGRAAIRACGGRDSSAMHRSETVRHRPATEIRRPRAFESARASIAAGLSGASKRPMSGAIEIIGSQARVLSTPACPRSQADVRQNASGESPRSAPPAGTIESWRGPFYPRGHRSQGLLVASTSTRFSTMELNNAVLPHCRPQSAVQAVAQVDAARISCSPGRPRGSSPI